MLTDLYFRLRALFRRKKVESELEDELRFHFENETQKLVHSGMTRGQAERQARLAFGGHEQMKENCRDARGTGFLEITLQDLRYGFRVLSKSRGYSLISLLTLAIGIGASVAMFSLVNTVLIKRLPYPNADRVVMPWRDGPIGNFFAGSNDFPWSPVEYDLFSRTQTIFQNLGAFKKDSFNLTGSASPELLEGVRATAGFFPALGVSPLIGRTFSADEDKPGHEDVAVLSYHLWQGEFGGDPGMAGRVIELNGSAHTVIGVMPASFQFPNQQGIPISLDLPKETQIWVPMALPPNPRGANELGVVGELKPGITHAQLEQTLAAFEKGLEEQYPQEKGWSTRVASLQEQTVSDARRPLLLFFGAVSVILLIACSNVAGLTLNRSLVRRREIVLRAALGAGPGRLIRQLMTESLILSLAGGALGVALARALIYFVKILGPDSLPRIQEAGVDLHVLGYALGISLLTGLLFGLAPAIGVNGLNLVEALKDSGQRSGSGTAVGRVRNALLIGQMALALMLLIASGLLVRTISHMLHTEAGFNATHVVTFELPLPVPKYADTIRMAQIYQQVLERLRTQPGVESAGLASVVPMGGPPDSTVLRIPGDPVWGDPAAIAVAGNAQRPYSNYSFVSPNYFEAVGASLLRGRDFTDADTLDSMHVTVINASMAKKYWPGVNPIGKQVGVPIIRFPARTIVGIVQDIKHGSLREPPVPEMFVPYTQNEIKMWPSMQTMQFAVRTTLDQTSIASSIREAVHSVDPDLPIAKFAPLNALVADSMIADRFAMLLISAFGALALILATVGMYSVISYSVMQRTPEIGIRIALGAQQREVFLMVLRQGGYIACYGIAVGLIAALGSTRLMARFLFGVSPTDPLTFASVALLMVFIIMLACYLPARKAMRMDPMVALHYE